MKIKFDSDDDLPLNKPLKFHDMTITIKSVFEEDVWRKEKKTKRISKTLSLGKKVSI